MLKIPLIVALAFVTGAAATAQQSLAPLTYVGCYQVTVGPWSQTAQGVGLIPPNVF